MHWALAALVALDMVMHSNQQLQGIAANSFASSGSASQNAGRYLAKGDLPVLWFSGGWNDWDELLVGFKREVPSKFFYRIIKSDSVLDSKHPVWTSTDLVAPGTKCADLLANSYIRVRVGSAVERQKVPLAPIPLQLEWKGNTLKTDNPGVPKSRVSSCCEAATCQDRCLEFETGQNWLLEIAAPQWGVDTSLDPIQYRSNQGGSYAPSIEQSDPGIWPVLRVPCVYCPLLNCITNCSNGEYATGYSEYAEEGFQMHRIACLPCAPGTWNTCVDKETCLWHIPSGPNDFNVGRFTIQPIKGGPVGACYPCSAITRCFTCRMHFQGTQKEAYVATSAWKCPGGLSAPVDCPSENFRMSSDGSDCVCKPGWFPDGPDCMPCPAGHMCPNGTKVQCDKHYYQPAQGATSCLTCGTRGDKNSFFKCNRQGRLLKFCDPSVSGTQDKDLQENCVICSQCRRIYTEDSSVAEDTKLVDCYRDN